MNNKHEFALYFAPLIKVQEGDEITIGDKELIHRMYTVLRMNVGQKCVLFNAARACAITIIAISKKELEAFVDEVIMNKPLKPAVRFLLPMLKKEALEEAIYSLVELGASEIQLVTTQKSAHDVPPKAMERLQKIIIAAAEQSKYYFMPPLIDPIPLDRIFNDDPLIFFDAEGEAPMRLIADIAQLQPRRLNLLIGPEGDLTPEEKELLKNNNALFCALTPTILRARAAVVVGLGMVRALLR